MTSSERPSDVTAKLEKAPDKRPRGRLNLRGPMFWPVASTVLMFVLLGLYLLMTVQGIVIESVIWHITVFFFDRRYAFCDMIIIVPIVISAVVTLVRRLGFKRVYIKTPHKVVKQYRKGRVRYFGRDATIVLRNGMEIQTNKGRIWWLNRWDLVVGGDYDVYDSGGKKIILEGVKHEITEDHYLSRQIEEMEKINTNLKLENDYLIQTYRPGGAPSTIPAPPPPEDNN